MGCGMFILLKNGIPASVIQLMICTKLKISLEENLQPRALSFSEPATAPISGTNGMQLPAIIISERTNAMSMMFEGIQPHLRRSPRVPRNSTEDRVRNNWLFQVSARRCR